jgi:diacylglycerol kinase family enzyme
MLATDRQADAPTLDAAEPRHGTLRVAVVMNVGSGSVGNDTSQRIIELFARAGVEAQLVPTPANDLAAAARAAIASPTVGAVIAAGGDGTISAVAGVLAGGPVPLGVLPVGTLNHFAKDINLPTDLAAAVEANARALREGRVASVDVGRVNGRTFINNSSIGFYPRVVRRRNKLRERLFRNKWVATLFALYTSVRRYPELDVSLRLGTGESAAVVHRCTPFVFVGNNRYALHLFALGGRTRLDAGELSVYVAHRPGRFGTVKLILLALFRRLKQARDFNAFLLKEVVVDTPKRRLPVALDGEVVYLRPPLKYEVVPGCLKVLAPG